MSTILQLGSPRRRVSAAVVPAMPFPMITWRRGASTNVVQSSRRWWDVRGDPARERERPAAGRSLRGSNDRCAANSRLTCTQYTRAPIVAGSLGSSRRPATRYNTDALGPGLAPDGRRPRGGYDCYGTHRLFPQPVRAACGGEGKHRNPCPELRDGLLRGNPRQLERRRGAALPVPSTRALRASGAKLRCDEDATPLLSR